MKALRRAGSVRSLGCSLDRWLFGLGRAFARSAKVRSLLVSGTHRSTHRGPGKTDSKARSESRPARNTTAWLPSATRSPVVVPLSAPETPSTSHAGQRNSSTTLRTLPANDALRTALAIVNPIASPPLHLDPVFRQNSRTDLTFD